MFKIKRISKKIVIAAVLLIVIIALGTYFLLHKQKNSEQPAGNTDQAQQEPPINFSPPTAEDVQRADENKERIIKDEQSKATNPSAPAGAKAVKPTITYAGQYGNQAEVGAYVSGIFEDGGTCQAIFQKGSQKFTKQVTAVRGANSVDCPVMSAAISEFKEKGSWTVSVSYSSANASGQSDPRQIGIN